MKVPFTRESLQAYDPEVERREVIAAADAEHIAQLTIDFCVEFKNQLKYTYKSRKYVWRKLYLVRPHLDPFLENLKRVFVDCEVVTDPLKSYILIDWS